MAIIDRFEEWQAHEQRLTELTAAEEAQRLRVLGLLAPFRAEEATFAQRVRDALLSGEEPPPPPEQPDLGGDAWGPGVFAQARAAHAAEGQRLRAQLAPQIEDLAAEAEEALRRRVTEDVLPIMEPILAEYRAMLAEVREVRWASESQRTERIRPSAAERTRSGITAADVLEAASTDVSLLDPDPLPGRPRRGRPLTVGAAPPSRAVPGSAVRPAAGGPAPDVTNRKRHVHLGPRRSIMRVLYIVGGSGWELNAAKTACLRGHEFSSANTIRSRQGRSRQCRECHRRANRASMARRRAQKAD